jgi:hypothetical protein
VNIKPIGARLPPESYRVEFRLRGLYLNGDQPDYRELHRAEIMLPRQYPAEKPYVVPVEPIFHPNIRDYFCIADYWAAGTTLADVVAKLGDMIQWRIYNPASPLDAIAAKWATEQEPTGLFPIGNVDLGVAEVDVQLRTKPTPARSLAPVTVDIPQRDGASQATESSSSEEDLVVILRTRARPDTEGLQR